MVFQYVKLSILLLRILVDAFSKISEALPFPTSFPEAVSTGLQPKIFDTSFLNILAGVQALFPWLFKSRLSLEACCIKKSHRSQFGTERASKLSNKIVSGVLPYIPFFLSSKDIPEGPTSLKNRK